MKERRIARFTVEITLSASATEAARNRVSDAVSDLDVDSVITDAMMQQFRLMRLPYELRDMVTVIVKEA